MAEVRGLEVGLPEPPLTQNDRDLLIWAMRALQEVIDSLNNYGYIQLKESHEEIDRPRDGLVAFADGTDWNPGSGRGAYVYSSGAWRFLG